MKYLTILFAGFLFASCGEKPKAKEETTTIDQDAYTLADDAAFRVKADWKLPLEAGGDGTNEVSLTFLNKDSSTPSSVEVLAFHPRMPMMNNHGTDEETQAFAYNVDQPNLVHVTGIYFSMAGEEGGWVVTLKARVQGAESEVKLDVPEVH